MNAKVTNAARSQRARFKDRKSTQHFEEPETPSLIEWLLIDEEIDRHTNGESTFFVYQQYAKSHFPDYNSHVAHPEALVGHALSLLYKQQLGKRFNSRDQLLQALRTVLGNYPKVCWAPQTSIANTLRAIYHGEHINPADSSFAVGFKWAQMHQTPSAIVRPDLDVPPDWDK